MVILHNKYLQGRSERSQSLEQFFNSSTFWFKSSWRGLAIYNQSEENVALMLNVFVLLYDQGCDFVMVTSKDSASRLLCQPRVI